MAEYTTKRLKELESRNSTLAEENETLKRENKLKQEELEFWERSSQQQSSSARHPSVKHERAPEPTTPPQP